MYQYAAQMNLPTSFLNHLANIANINNALIVSIRTPSAPVNFLNHILLHLFHQLVKLVTKQADNFSRVTDLKYFLTAFTYVDWRPVGGWFAVFCLSALLYCRTHTA